MAQIIISSPNFNVYDNDGLDLVARTGSTSIELLHKAGAQGVIFGHSETGDTPEVINQKLKTLLDRQTKLGKKILNYSTILIGETWEEYYQLPYEKVVGNVLKRTEIIFKDIPFELIKDFVIGYEPKWGTRGSGQVNAEPASFELVNLCNKGIKNFLVEKYGSEAQNIKLIFGGLTTPDRAFELLKLEYVDALILGSASNTVEKFLSIAKAMHEAALTKNKVIHVNFKVFNRTDSDESYIEEFKKLSDDFVVYVAPPLTDIYKFSLLTKTDKFIQN